VVVGGVKAAKVTVAKGDERCGQSAAILQSKNLARVSRLATDFNHKLHTQRIAKELVVSGLLRAQILYLTDNGRTSRILANVKSHPLESAQSAEAAGMSLDELLGRDSPVR